METPSLHAGQTVSAGIVDTRPRLQGFALAGVLAGLMLTLLLSALDSTIVGTALPRIIGSLHGFSDYTWVVTAYLLTSTTMIPIVGKLSDQFGRKWFLIGGVVVFLIGSALSGLSQTMEALIIFRALQGIGAGALMSLTFTIIGDIFAPAERARWQGLFSGVFALASVIGPAVGGWLTDNGPVISGLTTDATRWRWVFYVNMPVGILALIVLITQLPANISIRSNRYRGWAAIRRIDFLGAVLAAGGTICLLLGLTWGGQTYPWNSAQVIGILVASVALFIGFAIAEHYAVEPILPFDLFKNQIFAASGLLSLTIGMALFAVAIYLPLFIQGVLGQTATNSGAAITPLMLALAACSAIGGQLIARIGRYQWLAISGGVVLAFGIFLLTRLDVHSTLGNVTVDMIVVGIGMGMVSPVLTLAVQNAIPRSRLGVGTGAVTYLRSMGSTLGTAVLGTVVNNTVTAQLNSTLPPAAHRLPAPVLAAATNQQVLVQPGAPQQLVQQVVQAATAQVPAGPAHAQTVQALTQQITALFNQIFEATRQALAVGIQHAFMVGLFVSFAVIIITLFLKDVPLLSAAQRTKAALEQSDGSATAEEEQEREVVLPGV